MARASWTWIPNSTWVNDLRFGWDRYPQLRILPRYRLHSGGRVRRITQASASSAGGQRAAFPTITISGFSGATGTNALGGAAGTFDTSGI